MRDTIAYVGHSYHNKTKSTAFLIEYLKEFFEVDVFFDDIGNGNKFDYSLLDQKDYIAIIFFQSLPPKECFDAIKCRNIIYFPMYDHIRHWNFYKWYDYKDCKIINFCKHTHKKLKKWGFNTTYMQYFPEPKEFYPGNDNEIFFWQRCKEISIINVKKLFKLNQKYKMHIHKSTDPGIAFTMPLLKDEKRLEITYSSWFETREELTEIIKQKQIYVAPRPDEGIGMSFLEAMAMGKAVVANNSKTMNEYIKHGVTGYLFNFSFPRAINFSNIKQIQKNAYEYCKVGYKKWLQDRAKIISIVNGEPETIEIPKFKKTFYFLGSMQKKDIIRLKFGRSGYLCLLGYWIYKRT